MDPSAAGPPAEILPPLPPAPARRTLLVEIERLPLSADAKVMLARLMAATVTVGGRVLAIGRQVLGFVLEAVRAFPMTTFGLVIGVVLSLLVGSVAVLGMVLGPLLGPLLIALGIGIGALSDIQSHSLRLRITLFEAQVAAAARG